MTTSPRFSVEYDTTCGAFLIFFAGKYYATATTAVQLSEIISLKREPFRAQEETETLPLQTDRAAIAEWRAEHEPTKCPTRAVAPTQALAAQPKAKVKAKPKPLPDNFPDFTLEELGL